MKNDKFPAIQARAVFEKALQHYKNKEFSTALELLNELYERFPETGCIGDAYYLNGDILREDGDFSAIEALCQRLGVPYTVKRTELASVIFDVRKESNPCSLCARMRRGILHDTAKELGCNKLALGHHRDDAAETFLMNLRSGGTIGCFSPVTYLSRKDLTMIRPLIYCPEAAIAAAAAREKLPVAQSRCPQDPLGNRSKTKDLMAAMQEDCPDLAEKIIAALQKGNISGW